MGQRMGGGKLQDGHRIPVNPAKKMEKTAREYSRLSEIVLGFHRLTRL
jgi:hypothetical protein